MIGINIKYQTTQEERERMIAGVANNPRQYLAGIIIGQNDDGTMNARIWEDGEGSFVKKSISEGIGEGQYKAI